MELSVDVCVRHVSHYSTEEMGGLSHACKLANFDLAGGGKFVWLSRRQFLIVEVDFVRSGRDESRYQNRGSRITYTFVPVLVCDWQKMVFR